MNKRYKGAFLLLFVILIVLTGCGKTNTASSVADANVAKANSSNSATDTALLKELTVATVGHSPSTGPIYFAEEKEIWAKHGLKVKQVSLDPAASVAALISGDVQIVFAGPNIVDAALKTENVKVIGTYGEVPMWLYGKNIGKLEELKGKTIGSTTPGGAVDYVTRTMIRSIGMQHGKDVKVLYAGSSPSVLAAMSENKIAAGILTPPTTIQAEKMGFVSIAYLNEVDGVLGKYGVMGANRPFAEKDPQVIENFMKAFVEAGKLMKTDDVTSKAVLKRRMNLTDDDVLNDSYKIYQKIWPTDLHIPENEIQFLLEELSVTNPVAKTKKPADVMDNRYADAVK